MKKIDLAAVSISTFVCLVAFLTSNNLFVGLGILLIFIAYYFLVIRKKIKAYLASKECIYACTKFINSFLVTLSIKESLEDAFQQSTHNTSENFHNYVAQIQEMNINEKIDYLKNYFRYSIYKMFTNVVSLYVDQGGNVLKLSESLLAENSRVEEAMNETQTISKNKAIEFVILWALAFVVILFMRFALMDFYMKMLNSVIFLILLIVFFLLFLLSSHVFISRLVNLPIKEDIEDE